MVVSIVEVERHGIEEIAEGIHYDRAFGSHSRSRLHDIDDNPVNDSFLAGAQSNALTLPNVEDVRRGVGNAKADTEKALTTNISMDRVKVNRVSCEQTKKEKEIVDEGVKADF